MKHTNENMIPIFNAFDVLSENTLINEYDSNEPRYEKTCFFHMRTTKAQISASAQSAQHLYCSLPR